ncbi:ankyrin repeat domain-containing protein [Clostridium sp. YIM B02505]|uniref:Ankyrin repeat domain-containing protein n=1 Tax=Clostridium yunnanense TaxID=2800325 RepID=A0ABS1EN33_9CLOT|nr:ankyrin repeat domain-containing protein [Clostridium yunnanense]MBK1810781.1 ankyrin repeat domain-containing protein [Clostridium yunnanense]
MKKLFIAIRQGDIETVKALLEKKPELISCTAKQPPKKDHGQSPLQVAIKSGNFEVAEYLLDLGADVNFMESESCYEWRMPVLQDAIMAAVRCSRWNTNDEIRGFCEFNSKEKATAAFHILKRMLHMESDVDCLDSYGNSCLMRAILDARQILPSYYYNEDRISDDRIITDELKQDLTQIFDLLFQNGADVNEIDRISDKTLYETYEKEPVSQLLMKNR